MPRRKYNPDGSNEYSAPQEKPPRYDLRRRHKTLDDPLDIKDRLKEENDMKLSEETLNIEKISEKDEILLAKKLAYKKIKLAGEIKHVKDTSNIENNRQYVNGYPLKEEGLYAIASTYKCLGDAFQNMVKANNIFAKIKSSQISPDGKIGGMGYIQSIKNIRNSLAQTVNIVSDLLDTFYDEINSPHWKKQTEDMESLNQSIQDTDDKINEAEENLENFEVKENVNAGNSCSGWFGEETKSIQS